MELSRDAEQAQVDWILKRIRKRTSDKGAAQFVGMYRSSLAPIRYNIIIFSQTVFICHASSAPFGQIQAEMPRLDVVDFARDESTSRLTITWNSRGRLESSEFDDVPESDFRTMKALLSVGREPFAGESHGYQKPAQQKAAAKIAGMNSATISEEELATQTLAQGQIDNNGSTLSILKDGRFVLELFAKSPVSDVLLALETDADSIRRKSVTGKVAGRAAAVVATGGLAADPNFWVSTSQNRGVVYLTITGQGCGVMTFPQKNPTNAVLESHRILKAAAVQVLKSEQAPTSTDTNIAEQIASLAEMHKSGLLTAEEFTAAKARLLA